MCGYIIWYETLCIHKCLSQDAFNHNTIYSKTSFTKCFLKKNLETSVKSTKDGKHAEERTKGFGGLARVFILRVQRHDGFYDVELRLTLSWAGVAVSSPLAGGLPCPTLPVIFFVGEVGRQAIIGWLVGIC